MFPEDNYHEDDGEDFDADGWEDDYVDMVNMLGFDPYDEPTVKAQIAMLFRREIREIRYDLRRLWTLLRTGKDINDEIPF